MAHFALIGRRAQIIVELQLQQICKIERAKVKDELNAIRVYIAQHNG